jgi:bile acid:Na+ symporter, BASS family
MEATILTKVVLPLALFIIMLGMGLSLVVQDFARIVKHPKAVVIGLFGQMVVLPAIGLGVVYLYGMDPLLAAGLMILALSPGGTTSNMIAYLSRGDVALSISLTAVVSLVTPLTIPLLGSVFLAMLLGEAKDISLPMGQTIVQLVAITLVPVGIGMLLKKRFPKFSEKTERPVKILSLVFLFLIIGGIMRQNWDKLPGFFAETGLAALTLNVSTMVIGFFGALSLRLERKQAITIGVEVGIQNGTMALLVTGTILNNPTMSIAPAIYSLIMFGTGAVFGIVVNLWKGREAPAEKAPALRTP